MQSCELLEAAVSGRTLLDLDLAGNLPSVLADVGTLREVVVSLVRHAAENLEGAPGTIRVRTSLVPTQKGDGRQVGLEVRHTGWGMETPNLHDGFLPGGRASGNLGIAEVRAIAESQGGSLSIASGQGACTRILVLIPCDPEAERR
jgi:nitrogen-specific signal transduction histidine kinase